MQTHAKPPRLALLEVRGIPETFEGRGVADVLFGDNNFQGRLSYSWPKTADENFNAPTKTTSLCFRLATD